MKIELGGIFHFELKLMIFQGRFLKYCHPIDEFKYQNKKIRDLFIKNEIPFKYFKGNILWVNPLY